MCMLLRPALVDVSGTQRADCPPPHTGHGIPYTPALPPVKTATRRSEDFRETPRLVVDSLQVRPLALRSKARSTRTCRGHV